MLTDVTAFQYCPYYNSVSIFLIIKIHQECITVFIAILNDLTALVSTPRK